MMIGQIIARTEMMTVIATPAAAPILAVICIACALAAPLVPIWAIISCCIFVVIGRMKTIWISSRAARRASFSPPTQIASRRARSFSRSSPIPEASIRTFRIEGRDHVGPGIGPDDRVIHLAHEGLHVGPGRLRPGLDRLDLPPDPLLLLLGLGRRLVRLQRIDLLLARRLGLGLGLLDRTLREIDQHRRQERHPDLEGDEEQHEGGEDDVERARRLRQRRVRHGISRRKGVRHGHRGSRVLGRSRDGPGATHAAGQ